MKNSKILRMFGIVLILSLLMAVIPAAPVLAFDYTISLSPTQGKIGDTIHINGSSFTPSTETSTVTNEKHARIIFAAEQVITGKYIDTDVKTYKIVGDAIIGYSGDTDEGDFSTTFNVPSSLLDGSTDANVAPGTYYVYVAVITSSSTSNPLIRSVATFTVTPGATLDPLSPASGPAGTQVQITGANFPANATLVIKYDDTPIPIIGGDTVTKSSGILISTITIPSSSTTGVHNVTVTAGTSTATKTFTVTASATLDALQPASGPVGANVTVSGSNFAVSSPIVFKFDALVVTPTSGDLMTRSSGLFMTIVTIPESTAGTHNITVTVGSTTVPATFTVLETPPTTPPPTTPPPPTPGPTPPPTPVKPALTINSSGDTIGSNIGIGGAGFTPSANVTFKYDDTEVAKVTADADGLVMAIFAAPPSQHGDHTITVSDGTKTNTVTYTVESVAPDTPPPLLPEMGVKAKSPVTFDWEDVTDDSQPVTYDLQIAIDNDFAADSIVWEKKNIEASTYMLTEAEELKLAGRQDAFYWRVKAVDAASNESAWTGAGEFYFGGGSSSFPSWALYTLIGVGGVILFGIGYWLGRRTAFYY